MSEKLVIPWVVVAPNGVYWLGRAEDEKGAWTIALGWPDLREIEEKIAEGWYASPAAVQWSDPKDPEQRPRLGSKVRKREGYGYHGIVAASFKTLKGKTRIVVENTNPDTAGMLHIFNPEQMEEVPE